jgi:predicted RNA-binding Zn-ribbon protein involved in translation (DUF1610 family)
MPKLRCLCNYIFDLSAIPCEHEYYLVSENQLDELDGKPMSTNEAIAELQRDSQTIYLCPECGRFAMIRDDDAVKFYKMEQIIYPET